MPEHFVSRDDGHIVLKDRYFVTPLGLTVFLPENEYSSWSTSDLTFMVYSFPSEKLAKCRIYHGELKTSDLV